MSQFGDMLEQNSEEILDRWYKRWKQSPHPHSDLSEKKLRDHFAVQLRAIGKELGREQPEDPGQMWQQGIGLLDPEERYKQGMSIKVEILAYKILLRVVREWIDEASVDITRDDYIYFYEALFELVAESVERYNDYAAEETRKERSRYLAGIAHQMRTPISAISMGVQLLDVDVEDDESRYLLKTIHRGSRRLELLVNGLMRLERFDPEELPVRPQKIDMSQFVDNIAEDQRMPLEEKKLELRVDLNLDSIQADPELLYDVLGNLVDNAVKFTDEGFVAIRARREEDVVLIEVIDSGPGMSEERRSELFKPVISEKVGGVGLGLTIARRAVKAQGGSIGVDSELGEGSRFWVRLPAEVEPRNL